MYVCACLDECRELKKSLILRLEHLATVTMTRTKAPDMETAAIAQQLYPVYNAMVLWLREDNMSMLVHSRSNFDDSFVFLFCLSLFLQRRLIAMGPGRFHCG